MLLLAATTTMKTRRPPTTMSSPLPSALLWLFSLFGILMKKGEKRVFSIHHFSFLVCNGRSCTYGGCIMDKYFYVWLV
jgi:hypothetical protein